MACTEKQAAFEGALGTAQKKLADELAVIAADAESKAKEVGKKFEQSNDLAQGVGAVSGSVVGGLIGGPPGAMIGATIGKEIGKLFTIEITDYEQRVSLDLPEVNVKQQEWKIDVPEVRLKDNDIIFNLPELVMVTKEGPPVPEVTVRMEQRCVGPICTDVPVTYVNWKKTYLDVPEWRTREHRIVLGLPEVTTRSETMVVGVPEVAMRTQEIRIRVPGITVRFITDAGKKTSEAASAVAQDAAVKTHQKQLSFRERIRMEVLTPAIEMFDCYKNELKGHIAAIAAKYDPQIAVLNASLAALKSKSVPDDDNDVIAVRKELESLLQQRGSAMQGLEAALAKLETAAKDAIDQLVGANED